MNIDTAAAGNEQVAAILAGGIELADRIVHRGEASLHNPATVVFEYRGGEFHFTEGADGKWRLASVSTWGNYQGIRGAAAGPSGFVVTDPAALDILGEAVSG